MKQDRPVFGATFWDLVDVFCEAHRQFAAIHWEYEAAVLAHADDQCIDRRQLRLGAIELSQLFDYQKLEGLRSGVLARAMELSHSLFREEGRRHRFDLYISELYHDLTILREEQYKVSTFAEAHRLANEMDAYENLLDEVHEDFPRRVKNMLGFFGKALKGLESVAQTYVRDPVYLRSLYLFGEEAFREIYANTRIEHCWRVFEHGPAEAFLSAARSFAQSGFREQALRALESTQEVALQPPPSYVKRCTREDLKALGDEAKSLSAVIGGASPADLVAMSLAPVHTPPRLVGFAR